MRTDLDNARDASRKGRTAPQKYKGTGKYGNKGPQPWLRKPPRPCANCSKPSKPLWRGLCHACDMYQRRLGKPRPLGRKPLKQPTPCAECLRLSKPTIRGLCRACYEADRRVRVGLDTTNRRIQKATQRTA